MARNAHHPAADPRQRLVLGIETSCDETAAAVVRAGRFVLSSVIASQHDLHAEYRGVVPEIASRAHAERLLPVVREALRAAGASLPDLAAVAVGHRPGLIGSLLVGVAGAKALAWSLGVPLIGVDHVHAHLYAGLLEPPADAAQPVPDPPDLYPALGLVVSGGHTALYRVDSPTSLARLGSTIDDAVGEAFDKVGAILGLPFPGGPAVDAAAARGDDRAFDFPVSRLRSGGAPSLDFSFSGLKTAVRYAVLGVPGSRQPAPPPLTPTVAANVCASFQRAAVAALVQRLADAADRGPPYRALVVGGGVSANSRLRADLLVFARSRSLRLVIPALEFCVDNAAMIAGLGHVMLADRAWESDPLSLTASPASAV